MKTTLSRLIMGAALAGAFCNETETGTEATSGWDGLANPAGEEDLENQPLGEDDDFEIDLTGVSTKIPILEPGKYHLKIRKVERKLKKDCTDRYNLVVFFTNKEAVRDNEGNLLPPGEALITKYYSLGPNPERAGDPDYNPDRWKVDLSQFIDSVFNTDETNRPKLNRANMAEMVGATVLGTVSIAKDKTGEYPDKNELKSVKFASVAA